MFGSSSSNDKTIQSGAPDSITRFGGADVTPPRTVVSANTGALDWPGADGTAPGRGAVSNCCTRPDNERMSDWARSDCLVKSVATLDTRASSRCVRTTSAAPTAMAIAAAIPAAEMIARGDFHQRWTG